MNLRRVFQRLCPLIAASLLGLAASPALLAQCMNPVLVFPQFAAGNDANGLSFSRVIIRNNTDQADLLAASFQDPDGNLVVLNLDGASGSSLGIGIGAFATFDFNVEKAGALQTGSVRICSDNGNTTTLEAALVFDLFGNQVSTDATPVRNNNQAYLSYVPNGENAGIAFYNPSLTQTAHVDATYVSNLGQEGATAQLTLGPGTQRSLFVTDPALFGNDFNLSLTFQGTVNVTSDVPIAILGLLQAADGSLVGIGSSPNVFQDMPSQASFCVCSAMVDPMDNTTVLVDTGLQGDTAFLVGNNQLIAALQMDNTPIFEYLPLNNAIIGGCGNGQQATLILPNTDVAPGFNQVKLVLRTPDMSFSTECIANLP